MSEDKDEELYRQDASLTKEELYEKYHVNENGISDEEREKRLDQYGRNVLSADKPKSWIWFLLDAFKDEFIIVLIVLGIISFVMDDIAGGTIIIILASLSGLLQFVQNYRSYKASRRLHGMIHETAAEISDNKVKEIPVEEVVPGDIQVLGGGDIVNGDVILIESKDFFISESQFTGESQPVEKTAGADTRNVSSIDLNNLVFGGCTVISGSAKGIVIRTGKNSYLGHISTISDNQETESSFDKGIHKITKLLMRYMIVVVIFVLLINGFVKGNWMEAFMFSVSVAVGITPGMLPMIVNSTLAVGAQFLARKETIVKKTSSIQNLGSMDVLCTDKTGTLTMDQIVLQRYLDVNGQKSKITLNYAYLNAAYSTGVKNAIDKAILAYGDKHHVSQELDHYQKIDEIPYDFERRRMSIIITGTKGQQWLITKGALESIIDCCSEVLDNKRHRKISEVNTEAVLKQADALNQDGLHVIGVAAKKTNLKPGEFSKDDETGMTLIGLVAFLDPPKPDVADAVKGLHKAGVAVKVLSGDAPAVVKHICNEVGIESDTVLTGSDIEKLDDKQLAETVEKVNMYARLAPMEKMRVVSALQKNGHTVGYMGDGVNDAPSLRTADVGISVNTATDVAKASADIMLLRQSLSVILDGVYEGRRIYGNIIKYMKMALSGNFGNVFSVLVASIFLPFLPMLPIQMLIQNLIYDGTQIAIPWDNVDPEFMEKPRTWDTHGLSSFMNVMGIVSSVFDILTFLTLWFVMKFNTQSLAPYFQTGWFVEGMLSQILIVQFIRTAKIPFIQSHSDIRLSCACAFGVIAALAVPYLFSSVKSFHFVILPAKYYIFVVLILILYMITIQVVKKFYIKKHGEWL